MHLFLLFVLNFCTTWHLGFMFYAGITEPMRETILLM